MAPLLCGQRGGHRVACGAVGARWPGGGRCPHDHASAAVPVRIMARWEGRVYHAEFWSLYVEEGYARVGLTPSAVRAPPNVGCSAGWHRGTMVR